MNYSDYIYLTNKTTGETIGGIYMEEDDRDVLIRCSDGEIHFDKSVWKVSSGSDIEKANYKAEYKWSKTISTEDQVVCPYCYESVGLDGEDFGNNSEFEEKRYCEYCDESFVVDAHVDYSFYATTKRIG